MLPKQKKKLLNLKVKTNRKITKLQQSPKLKNQKQPNQVLKINNKNNQYEKSIYLQYGCANVCRISRF